MWILVVILMNGSVTVQPLQNSNECEMVRNYIIANSNTTPQSSACLKAEK